MINFNINNCNIESINVIYILEIFNCCVSFGIDLGQLWKINLNTNFYKLLFMAILNIEVLKKILENIPEDYDVEFYNGTTNVPISDKVEIDVSGKRIVLKS